MEFYLEGKKRGDTMSDAYSTSHAGIGANLPDTPGSTRSLYQLATTQQEQQSSRHGDRQHGERQRNSNSDSNMAHLLLGQFSEAHRVIAEPGSVNPVALDMESVIKNIRRLTHELEVAKEEVKALETDLERALFVPPVRRWLSPLIVVGLGLSLYGSFVSSSAVQLAATALILCWTLGALWFTHTREKRREIAEQANKAEHEIWSNRIEELQQALAHNRFMVELMRK
jgi:hypothetical protein